LDFAVALLEVLDFVFTFVPERVEVGGDEIL